MVEILENYDEETYHARPELSNSQLVDFLKSPLTYWSRHRSESNNSFSPTASMRIGSMVHKYILEGSDAFDICYAQPPADGLRKPTSAQLTAKKPAEKTLEQIASWDEYEKSCAGKITTNPDELATAKRCISSIEQSPVAQALLNQTTSTEQTIIYDLQGVPMRSRLDGVTNDSVIDIKTTTDASIDGFRRSIVKYNYGLQAYIYSCAFYKAYGKFPKEFVFICVETIAPYHIGIYTLPNKYMSSMKHKAHDALMRFKNCNKHDVWPGYNNDHKVELPIRVYDND